MIFIDIYLSIFGEESKSISLSWLLKSLNYLLSIVTAHAKIKPAQYPANSSLFSECFAGKKREIERILREVAGQSQGIWEKVAG